MGKIERKYMAHFIDATFQYYPNRTSAWTPSWYRLGEDLEEYNVELNPSVEVVRNFLGDDIVIHDGYAMSGEVEPYYAYKKGNVEDALFIKLQSMIDNEKRGNPCHTLALDVQLWRGTATTANNTTVYHYPAVCRPCYIVPTSFGGDTSGYQIPFQIYYLNTSTTTGTFTPDGNGSGTFSVG